MTPKCWRAHSLLTRRAQGLDDANRLLLEEHLASCQTCAADAAILDGMRAQVDTAGEELSSKARRRALAGALRNARLPQPSAQPPQRSRVALVLAAACAAVLAALLVRATAERPTFDAQLATGLAGAASATAHDVPESLYAPPGTKLELGDAQIEALEPARLHWQPAQNALELESGALRIDLPRQRDRRFRVITSRFVVEVVGTRFEVDEDGVAVSRGRIRVLDRGGRDELARLAAGETWTWRTPPASASAAPVDVAQRIADARQELAAGRATKARSLLGPLTTAALTPRQAAEVQSLLAECALVEGNYREAARAYGAVASAHGDTLAGESALFAQARAHMRAGDKAAARSALSRYLARYPSGRFHKEAREHLRNLK